jgi:NAD(P)-dependent dehydrogenase (short-subunit alcohol dehydrogenase family)
MDKNFSLEGKSFLIAGGTRGIGRAISLQFARAGAGVVANYVRDDRSAQTLKEEAERERLDLLICRADLTSAKGLAHLDQFIGTNRDFLSGLVFCAATGVHKTLDHLNARHFDWTFSLNVRAFFELVKLLLPRFQMPAAIVALSSQGALQTIPSYSLVGASKGALESLARHLAVELAPKGVRVNILSPGPVPTGAWGAMPESQARLAGAAGRSPLRRLTSPEEVAWAAQFLCSDAAQGIIGHTLVVDGGLRLVGE